MWKKHGSALLGLILAVAIVLTGVKLPENVFASGKNDKTDLVKPTTKIEFRQPKYTYGNGGTVTTYEPITDKVDMSKDILVNVEFDTVFDIDKPEDERIIKGDFVEFELGQGLKLEGNNKTSNQIVLPVNDSKTSERICDAIFTVNPADGTLKVKFDFSNGAEAVFKKKDGKIGASISISVDGQTMKYEESKISIRLLDKEYEVINIKDDVTLKKEGKLDYKNGKIDWTITIERFIAGTDPKKYLSLKGYEFEDTLSNRIANEYIEGTLKVNDKLIDTRDANGKKLNDYLGIRKQDNMPEYQWVSYRLKEADLDTNNTGKVVITLSSYIDFVNVSKTYNNSVSLREPSGGARRTEAKVTVPKIGEKIGRIDETGKKITWTVDFNWEDYDLGKVTVVDPLKKDTMGRKAQAFKKAYFQRMTDGEWSAKEDITPEVSGIEHKFIINNVKERVLLTIETEIDPDSYRTIFENDAFIYWNGEVNYKAKLSANVETRPIGGVAFGTISKTAKTQLLAEKMPKYYSNNLGEYIGPQPEWTVRADKSTVPAPGEYYMYDTFIYDQNTVPNRSGVNSDNGYSIRKVGDSQVTTLSNGAKFDTVIPWEGKRQKLVNVEKPIIDSTEGITNVVYEILKGEKVVGHILELKLVPGVENYAKFSSMIADYETLTQWGSQGIENAGYNTLMLASGKNVVLTTKAAYKYHSKLISKQTLSAEAARKFMNDFNAETVNADVFDDVEKVKISNSDKGYDRNSKSVIFKIDVNTVGIKDVHGDIGKFVLREYSLGNDSDFEFVPIVKDEENPTNNKMALIYKGVPAIKYENTNEADYRIENSMAKAVGKALSDKELKDNNIVINQGSNPSNGFNISFDKLQDTYVVFVKVRLKEGLLGNRKGTVWNHARIHITEAVSREAQDYSWYDDRFLWKNYDGQDSKDKINVDDNGFIKWNVYYRPYKTYNDNNATKIKIRNKNGSDSRHCKECLI